MAANEESTVERPQEEAGQQARVKSELSSAGDEGNQHALTTTKRKLPQITKSNPKILRASVEASPIGNEVQRDIKEEDRESQRLHAGGHSAGLDVADQEGRIQNRDQASTDIDPQIEATVMGHFEKWLEEKFEQNLRAEIKIRFAKIEEKIEQTLRAEMEIRLAKIEVQKMDDQEMVTLNERMEDVEAFVERVRNAFRQWREDLDQRLG